MAEHLCFGLIVFENTVPKVFWFVQMQFCTFKPAAMFFFDRGGFLLADLVFVHHSLTLGSVLVINRLLCFSISDQMNGWTSM